MLILVISGLSLGSFVNALVFRLYMQMKQGKGQRAKGKKARAANLSIAHGRSVCVHCYHPLAWYDLVPVLSWLFLRGKCRYCHKSISWQYPLVELLTAALFVVSYLFWPTETATFGLGDWVRFAGWLVMLTGFMALIVYDLRWMLLPNKIVYPLLAVAVVLAADTVISGGSTAALYRLIGSLAIAGGLFFVLFQVSAGKWIGGGDVRLGLLAGLLLADPYKAFLMLFLASLLGCFVAVPGIVAKRLKASSRIPFGPFLIAATIIVFLCGATIIEWYQRSFMLY